MLVSSQKSHNGQALKQNSNRDIINVLSAPPVPFLIYDELKWSTYTLSITYQLLAAPFFTDFSPCQSTLSLSGCSSQLSSCHRSSACQPLSHVLQSVKPLSELSSHNQTNMTRTSYLNAPEQHVTVTTALLCEADNRLCRSSDHIMPAAYSTRTVHVLVR